MWYAMVVEVRSGVFYFDVCAFGLFVCSLSDLPFYGGMGWGIFLVGVRGLGCMGLEYRTTGGVVSWAFWCGVWGVQT